MSLEEVVDVGSGMASSLAGIASTAFQEWNKFVGVLVVPQVDPSVCRYFSRSGVVVFDDGVDGVALGSK